MSTVHLSGRSFLKPSHLRPAMDTPFRSRPADFATLALRVLSLTIRGRKFSPVSRGPQGTKPTHVRSGFASPRPTATRSRTDSVLFLGYSTLSTLLYCALYSWTNSLRSAYSGYAGAIRPCQ